jgi:hypothetical protein
MSPRQTASDSCERRRFLRHGLFASLSGLLFADRRAAQALGPSLPPLPAAPNGLQRSGEPLTTHLRQGQPPEQPLDSMVVFERGDDNNGRLGTHEILSLIHQEKGKRSYPWTLYASLETHHEEGDACVVCSRLHKHGPGWSTGLHSEVFNHARAVALGANIEMSSDYTGPESTQVIGLNIQAVKGPTPMQYGIHVHDGEGHFTTGVGLNGKGRIGLDLAGRFEVGVNARSNTIRVDEGTCVELDGIGQIRLRYLNGRIEFLNGDRCFGHLDVNGADHAL